MRQKQCVKWTACLLLAALSFVVFYSIAGQPASDISIHAAWAGEGSFLDPLSFVRHHAHPLWHFLVSPLLSLGMSTQLAAALVCALCKAVEFCTAYWLAKHIMGREEPVWRLTLASLGVVLVSTLCLPWYNPTVYLGVGTPNIWHSPTQLLVLSFAPLCVVWVAQSWQRCEQLGAERAFTRWQWLCLMAILVLSALAKPVFLQAYLPAAALYFLIKWIRNPQRSRYFVTLLAAVLPCVAVVCLQFVFYFLHPSDTTGMTLSLTADKAGSALVSLVLMEAFPLFVLLTDREARKGGDMVFELTLCTNAAGFLERFLLSETGRRASDGNFAWGLMASAYLMWAVMLPRFVRQVRTEKGRRWRAAAGWALLAWHAASGLYYIGYLLITGAYM